jgi:hypothetical protein
MPDPLTSLPYEIWTRCLRLAIHNQPAGPVVFIGVSWNWRRELLDSPALWTQIWIQNDENETARIQAFLRLSGRSPLDVYVKTVPPAMDRLQLLKPHYSRVRTVSIMPNMPQPLTTEHGEQWTRAASNIMATFSNQPTPWNASKYSCSGRRIGPDPGVYYVAVIEFFLSYPAIQPTSTDAQSRGYLTSEPEQRRQFSSWENYITRCVLACLSYGHCRGIFIEPHKASSMMLPRELYVLQLTLRTGSLIPCVESASFWFKGFTLSCPFRRL